MSNAYKRLFEKKELKVLMIGLDGGGKTTILYKLKLGEVVYTIPTIGFNVETLNFNQTSLTVWDVAASTPPMRRLWRHYFRNCQGLIFVIDSNDRERIDEVRDEFWKLLSEQELDNACIVVLANKQDLYGAMTVTEVGDALRLWEIPKDKQQWFITGCSATAGEGLYEGFDWISQKINESNESKLK